MDAATRKADELRQQISRAEKELEGLRRQLRDLEADPGTTTTTTTTTSTTAEVTTTCIEPHDLSQQPNSNGTTSPPPPEAKPWTWPLSEEEYERYARQLILPGFGTPAQLRLRASSVLIVGAGGLGCPAALYLAGAGVGTLGIVDGDTVEVSNLHRQVGHSTSSSSAGVKKAESLAARCRALNPLVRYASYAEHLGAGNAARVVAPYDVVLDCTDRPASRYLVSDACVLLGKPLVSASALRTDGQLIVLNYPPSRNRRRGGGDGGSGGGEEEEGERDREGGPCYRCVFPRPPPASSVLSCGEGGILGPVVGVMGVLQALEAIKLIVASPSPPQSQPQPPPSPSLLLFSAHSTPPTFRTVRMRGRRPDCFACSPRSTLTLEKLSSGSLDYAHFCGVSAPVGVLRPEERVSPMEYDKARRAAGVVTGTAASPEEQEQQRQKQHLLLDVREKEHYNVASIPGSVNVPFSKFQVQVQNNHHNNPVDPGAHASKGEGEPAQRPDWMPESLAPDAPIYVVCRVGNDSQLVTRKLKEMGLDRDGARFIGDIKGGMRAWKQEVDHTIPFT
ncbi:hypothetical protein SLS62_001226 [Diatrype stigma]|uniref:Adenylyltransferase and sulfurtransferase uba4 n=1 Tax=Diatrype stigma TaxID=117547 RepID=A0AAN9YS04_9PEZI